MRPQAGQLYSQFKGKLYRVMAIATHSETGEELVIYEAQYGDHQVYARPLPMFTEMVDRKKYPDAQQQYRFEPVQEDNQQEAEEMNIDPMVLEFLEADTFEERLNILHGLHARITDDMINTMALSVDLEIKDGDLEDRYEELKNCLLTFERYECNRLR
mgnify:FL=1